MVLVCKCRLPAMPQGTVLGPILFSLMVNDIQLADPRRNLLVKFADDITISIPVSKDSTDATINEVNSIRDWAASDTMTLNLSKMWEMLIHGKTTKPNPQPDPDIERKSWLLFCTNPSKATESGIAESVIYECKGFQNESFPAICSSCYHNIVLLPPSFF